MSGGSWDYVCHRIDDVVDRLESESDTLRAKPVKQIVQSILSQVKKNQEKKK